MKEVRPMEMNWKALLEGLHDTTLEKVIAMATQELDKRKDEPRHAVAEELNLMGLHLFNRAQNFREDYELYLNVILVNGRYFHIPFDERAIKSWEITVDPRKGEG